MPRQWKRPDRHSCSATRPTPETSGQRSSAGTPAVLGTRAPATPVGFTGARRVRIIPPFMALSPAGRVRPPPLRPTRSHRRRAWARRLRRQAAVSAPAAARAARPARRSSARADRVRAPVPPAAPRRQHDARHRRHALALARRCRRPDRPWNGYQLRLGRKRWHERRRRLRFWLECRQPVRRWRPQHRLDTGVRGPTRRRRPPRTASH